MFVGQYSQKLDEKNRIIIPAKFRLSLNQNSIITIGHEKCLTIYTEQGWLKLQTKLEELSDNKEAYRKYVRAIAANAQECDFDSHGRVTLAQSLISLAGIEKDIVIVGLLDHLEVWSKEAFDVYNAQAVNDFDKLTEDF